MPEILIKLFVKEDDFAPRGHLTMSGDLVVHIWEMATGVSVEAKNAVKHSTMDSTTKDPHNKGSGPDCQRLQD